MKFRGRRADDVPEYIVCGTDRNLACMAEKSCHRCGRAVWVALSGQEVLRKFPAIKVVCWFCFEPSGVDTVLIPTPGELLKDMSRGN